MKKAIFLTMILCGFSVAQERVDAQNGDTVRVPTAACGDEKVTYDVAHGNFGDAAKGDREKALVYIVELYSLNDQGRFNRPTIRQGLDGTWIGATQGFSYVSALVDPGTHHLCSRWQSHFGKLSEQVSLNSFEAVAGGRYYFRTQITVQGGSSGGALTIDLQPVSEDEGRFLVSEAAQSISKPKK